jgi:uncharacterized protein (DUF849 family)
MGAIMGGNVRVGLEDSLYAGPGRLAQSNVEQIKLMCTVLKGLSLEVASPDVVRDILQLKGAHAVGF